MPGADVVEELGMIYACKLCPAFWAEVFLNKRDLESHLFTMHAAWRSWG